MHIDWKKFGGAMAMSGLLIYAIPAFAGPTYTFTTSTGVQPSDVGIITLTQINANTVDVLVDLKDTSLPLPQYGFINTGGPHTPFVFTLAGTETGVSATFLQPAGGSFCPGTGDVRAGALAGDQCLFLYVSASPWTNSQTER